MSANTKPSVSRVSWSVYAATLPLVFLSGSVFQSLLTGNRHLDSLQKLGQEREVLRQSYKKGLEERDQIIKQLEQLLERQTLQAKQGEKPAAQPDDRQPAPSPGATATPTTPK